MSDAPTKQKLWGGRFTGKTDPLWVLNSYYNTLTKVSSQNACVQPVFEL